MEFTKPFNKDYLNPVDKYLRLQTVLHSVHLYDHSSWSVYTWLLYKTGSEVLEVLF